MVVLSAPVKTFEMRRGFDAPQGEREFYEVATRAMGTQCRIIHSAPSRTLADSFRQNVSDWLVSFEARYSRFRPDSIVSRINSMAGKEPVEIDAEFEGLLALCDWYHWLTHGVFDPSILPVSLLWDYHSPNPRVPSGAEVTERMKLVGWKTVRHEGKSVTLPKTGMAIDLGGIGKEYAVDSVFEMAREMGFRDIMVDFGHDVRVAGSPPEGGPWKVGLESPLSPGRCWTGVAVDDMAVASSGNYARRFVVNGKSYGHILDPRTGHPSDNGALAVSIIAPTCTEAGIIATASIVLGPDEFASFVESCHQVEGAMVTGSGRIRSARFGTYEMEPARTRDR